jgi:hypothetical protein
VDTDQMKKFIEKQLALLRIDPDTIRRVRSMQRVVDAGLDTTVREFYRHMLTFPEGKTFFADANTVQSLANKQREHWRKLFACTFDESFVTTAQTVGQAHYQHKVAPYLYIAGYAFFQGEIARMLCERYAGSRELPDMLVAMTRIIALDMDLAISIYTKEYWSQGQPPSVI